ncbi:MAG: MFS transporter [Rhodocyclaceae bacterium]|nr:MFS transporter [Rhodocyclaceae bacterium]
MFATPPCDDAVIRTARDAAPCAAAARKWVLAATILASSMAFIDGTVVNVALPALQRDLRAGIADVQWVVEAYALLLAALLLMGGAAGDRFGRRRVFMLGVAVFAAASACCGLADGVRALIVARAAQGIGGALLVPGSLAIISASFDERERGRAIGTWSGATAITTALGPVLGGWMTDHLSWRAVFFINLPLAVAVLALASWRVPESKNPQAQGALDWPGALLATCGLAGIVYALIEAPGKGWHSATIAGSLTLGAAALAAFVAIEARCPAPMIPLSVFASRNFSGANLLTLLLYAALGGGLFFLPLNLIQVQRYSATAAGAALLPLILLMFTLSRWSGGLFDRYGARRPLMLGPLVAAAGFALLAVPATGASYWTGFFPAITVLGFGLSLSVAPLTATVMSALGSARAGIASGINNAASRVAGLLAVAAFGVVLAPVFERTLELRLAQDNGPAAVRAAVLAQRDRLAAIELPAGLPEGERTAARRAVDESFVAGFRCVMLIAALLAAASSLSAWALLRDAAAAGSVGKS